MSEPDLTPGAKVLLADPAISLWLKSALMSALERDPVDALNDALVLAEVLDAQLRMTLGLDDAAPLPPSDTPLSESFEDLIEDGALPP